MAISLVQAVGNNTTTSAGTTLSVSFTGATKPQVGDLVVVHCARDNLASDPLTGDSFSDGEGNTYTREITGVTLGSAAGGAVCVQFWSILTSAWTGDQTLTWTSPSVAVRSMYVQHFTPSAGTLTQVDAVAAGSGTTAVVHADAQTGDLLVGTQASENNALGTGDSDTSNGSWTSIVGTGTGGGTAASRMWVQSQHKITTGTGSQSWLVTTAAGDECHLLNHFREVLPPPAGEITFTTKFGQAWGDSPAVTRATTSQSYAAGSRILVHAVALSDNHANGLGASGAGWANPATNASVNTVTWTLVAATAENNNVGAGYRMQAAVWISSELTATEAMTVTVDAHSAGSSQFYYVLQTFQIETATGSLVQAAAVAATNGASASVTLGSAPTGHQMLLGGYLYNDGANGGSWNAAPTNFTAITSAAVTPVGAMTANAAKSQTDDGAATWGHSGTGGFVTTLILLDLGIESAGGDEDVAVSVVGRTSTVGAPTVTATAAVAVSAVGRTSTVGAPTVVGSAAAAPAVVVGVAAVLGVAQYVPVGPFDRFAAIEAWWVTATTVTAPSGRAVFSGDGELATGYVYNLVDGGAVTVEVFPGGD